MKALLLGGLLCAILGLAAPSAFATGNFPGAIQNDLQLSSTPPCSYCHVGDPGPGTVRKPFGQAMRAHGLVPGDETSLRAALEQLQSNSIDSDGDGVPDIEELKEGTDPNEAANGIEPVSYGCMQTRTPRVGSGLLPWTPWTVLLAMAAVVLSLVRRRQAAPRLALRRRDNWEGANGRSLPEATRLRIAVSRPRGRVEPS